MATKSSSSRGNFRKGAVPGRGAVPANPPGNGGTRGAVAGQGKVPAKPPANQGGTSDTGSDKK